MKLVHLTLIGGVIGCMLTATTFAQVYATSLNQPASVQSTAYASDSYLYFAPQDAAATDQAAPPAPSKEQSSGPGCVEGCGSCEDSGCDHGCGLLGLGILGGPLGDPWTLPQPCILAERDIKVSGWLDMGITGNADNPPSQYNGVLAPNDRNQFQFNQAYLYMEKPLNTDEPNWDIGGRIDLLYGTDWIFGQSLGLENNPDGTRKWNSGIDYGLIMPQIYVNVGYGDLSLKLGHFYSIIGYESLMPIANFFYSMNYCVRYMEATAYTGGMFTWKQSDELSIYLGGVNGQDRFDGQADTFAVIAGFDYTPEAKKYLFHFAIQTAGQEPGILPVQGLRTYADTYLTYNLTDKYQSVTQFDYGWQDNFDLADNTATFYSITQYLFYTINEKWKAGLRYDYTRDEQGTMLGGLRFGGQPGGNPLPLPSGNAGAVQGVTAGVNWIPNANLRIRPELRWDWFEGSGLPLFDDRTQNRQFTAAVDAIFTF